MDYFFYNTDAGALVDLPRPRYPVLIDQGVAAVGGDKLQFGEQLRQLSPNDVLLMYENRTGIVGVGRVREFWDGITHADLLYYSAAEAVRLTGGPHEYRIAVEWFLDLSGAPISVAALRTRIGYAPRGTIKKIVEQRVEVARAIEEVLEAMSLLPGEVARPSGYTEGATKRITVNAYERSREAVKQCKLTHGTVCTVCRFDFGSVYGAEFAGFIHVHHLRPLSEIGDEYMVDPSADLCPVCPNCHAVIHHGGRLRSIEELQQLLRQEKQA